MSDDQSRVPALPNADLIQRHIRTLCHSEVQIHAFEQLGSTSVWLREHAAELEQNHGPVNHLCITDWQSAGVGRRGKSWQARPGNLMFSLLSFSDKPARDLIGLSLVTGIAVAEGLQDIANMPVQLKWPNDLILTDTKLGGLITELAAGPLQSGKRCTRLLTGIGINLLHDETVLELSIGATSLEAVGVRCARVDRDAIAGRLVAGVLAAHQRFEEAGWSVFAERWAALDWLHDKEVLIHRDKSTEQAVARGVNEQGALLVERAGEITPVYSGNVSIRPSA